MPRPRKLQPDYCHHTTSGRAYVRVAGRQIWLGQHGTQASKDRYLAVVAEWVAKGRPATDTQTPGVTPKPGDGFKRSNDPLNAATGPTITLLIEPYWTHAQSYYKKNGRQTAEVGCIKVMLRLLRQLYGDCPVGDFDSLKLLALRVEMIRKGWARKTVNDHVGRVKRFLKWSVMMKTFPADNYVGCAAIPGLEKGRSDAKETERKKPVPMEHVNAVLPFLSRQVRTMVELEILCGARPGELVSMRKMDIDRSGAVWVYKPKEHKTEHHEHDRQVFIGPEGQALLAPFLMRPDDAPVFSPREAERERREVQHEARVTPLLAGNRPGSVKTRNPKRAPGDGYSVGSYRKSVNRAIERANEWAKGGKVVDNNAVLIPHFHPHRLRHNCATAVRAKYGAEAAKMAIGVKNLDVAELYAERDLKAVATIMAAIG